MRNKKREGEKSDCQRGYKCLGSLGRHEGHKYRKEIQIQIQIQIMEGRVQMPRQPGWAGMKEGEVNNALTQFKIEKTFTH